MAGPFNELNSYILDGTTCTLNVVRASGTEACGLPGYKDRCEFHYMLTRYSKMTAAYRVNRRGPLIDRYVPKYERIISRLADAIHNDNKRKKMTVRVTPDGG